MEKNKEDFVSGSSESDNLKLFPYQELGAFWLSEGTHRILADEMGLGKSAQAIHAADLLRANKILVLCPAVARENWLREFQKFSISPRHFEIIQSRLDKNRHHLYPSWQNHSLICSYDLADNLNEILNINGMGSKFDLIILDEFHYLKSHTAKRTKAVFGKNGLIRKAPRCFALSGTPAPNHPGELWPTLFTFGITKLSYTHFIERFCNYYELPQHRGIQITGAKIYRIPELKSLMAPHILRRKKEDVLKELPPIHYTNIVVPPGKVDLDIEASFTQYVFPHDRRHVLEARLKKEKNILDTILNNTRFTRDGFKALEAISNSISTLRMYTGIQKVQAVADLVAHELDSNAYEKIVIFGIHQGVIEGLRQRLRRFGAVTLYGQTPPVKRQRHIDKFQRNPKTRVFIGNIQAAGTAITLTAAHHVIFIEQDWVPGNNAQAAMRCHRIGQTKPVFVRFVGLVNSLDEKIAQRLKQKTKELVLLFDQERLQDEISFVTETQTEEKFKTEDIDLEGIFS